MYCTNCGAELKDDAKFCTKCGQKVQHELVDIATAAATASAAEQALREQAPAVPAPGVPEPPAPPAPAVPEPEPPAPEPPAPQPVMDQPTQPLPVPEEQVTPVSVPRNHIPADQGATQPMPTNTAPPISLKSAEPSTLPSPAVTGYCAVCGTPMSRGMVFCPACGHRVGDPVPQPQAASQTSSAPTASATSPVPVRSAVTVARKGSLSSGMIALVAGAAVVAVAIIAIAVAPALSGSGSTAQNPAATEAGSTSADAGTSDEETNRPQLNVPIDASVSTPIGNLTNGGYVCEDDNYIYYAAPDQTADDWFTSSITRQNKSNGSTEVVYTTSANQPLIYHLNVESGRLIFSEESGTESARIMSVGTDGSNPVELATSDVSSLCQVYQGLVYYQAGSVVRVMNPDGTDQKIVYSPGPDMLWRVADGKVFYFAQKEAQEVRGVNLDGSGDYQVCTLEGSRYGEDENARINVMQPVGGQIFVLIGNKDERGGYAGFLIPESGGTVGGSLAAEAEISTIIRINMTEDGTLAIYQTVGGEVGPGFSTEMAPMTVNDFIHGSGLDETVYQAEDNTVNLFIPTYINGEVYFGRRVSGNNALMHVTSGGSVERLS